MMVATVSSGMAMGSGLGRIFSAWMVARPIPATRIRLRHNESTNAKAQRPASLLGVLVGVSRISDRPDHALKAETGKALGTIRIDRHPAASDFIRILPARTMHARMPPNQTKTGIFSWFRAANDAAMALQS